MPKISVVIPAHNEASYIKDTLDSIKKQTRPANEIVVVCDSCADNTASIVKEHEYLPIPSIARNTGANRNIGAGFTQGDILVFNDADAIMAENYLESVEDAVRHGYNYGCAQYNTNNQDLATRLTIHLMNAACKFREYVNGNFFIEKKLFQMINGFDVSLTSDEETDLADRVRGHGTYVYLKNTFLIPSTRKFDKSVPNRELMNRELIKLLGGSRLYMARIERYKK